MQDVARTRLEPGCAIYYLAMKSYAVLPLFVLLVSPAGAGWVGVLPRLTLAKTTFFTAERGAAGAFPPPVGQPIRNLPAFCRVAGTIKPSADSDIRFEVWMPAS